MIAYFAEERNKSAGNEMRWQRTKVDVPVFELLESKCQIITVMMRDNKNSKNLSMVKCCHEKTNVFFDKENISVDARPHFNVYKTSILCRRRHIDNLYTLKRRCVYTRIVCVHRFGIKYTQENIWKTVQLIIVKIVEILWRDQ